MMCKCKDCNKKDTEMCIRIIEAVGHQQNETMMTIEMEALKHNYNNLLKGIEKVFQLISQEQFYKIKNIEDTQNDD